MIFTFHAKPEPEWIWDDAAAFFLSSWSLRMKPELEREIEGETEFKWHSLIPKYSKASSNLDGMWVYLSWSCCQEDRLGLYLYFPTTDCQMAY